jgi:hypothetical protein
MKNYEKMENVNNNDNIVKLDLNKCSLDCCAFNQYKSKELPDNTKETSKLYVPTNFTCDRGNGRGCVCVTQDEFDYISNRGLYKKKSN